MGIILLLFGAALILGHWGTSRLMRTHDQASTVCISMALGLYVFSTMILLFGLCGILERWIFVGLPCVVVLWGRRVLWDYFQCFGQWWNRLSRSGQSGGIVIVLLSFLFLWGAFVPPLGYDGLEYHLGAPAEYLRHGKILFLENNVYANFPALVEMLYLWGLVVGGDVMPKLIHAALGFLALGSIFVLAKQCFGQRTAFFSALFLIVFPGFFILLSQAFIDLGVLAYGLLSLVCFKAWLDTKTSNALIAFSGFLAGAAISCKYTAILLLFIPSILFIALLGSQAKLTTRQVLWKSVLYGACAGLAFGPWMLKNLCFTGNPVYPFLFCVFGGQGWSEAQQNIFNSAHLPPPLTLSYIRETLKNIMFQGNLVNISMLFFAPFCLMNHRKNGSAKVMLLLLAVMVIVYLIWTRALWRFFIIGYALWIMLAAQGVDNLLRSLIRPLYRMGIGLLVVGCVLYGAVINFAFIASQDALSVVLGFENKETYLARTLPHYSAIQYLNQDAQLSPGGKILFVGEARMFYVKKPIVSHVAFNNNPLEAWMRQANNSVDALADLLRDNHIEIIFINHSEVQRLHQSYGYMEHFDWKFFSRFARSYLEVVFQDDQQGLVVYAILPLGDNTQTKGYL